MAQVEISISKEALKKKKIMVATPMYGGQCYGYYTKACTDLVKTAMQYGVQVDFFYLFNESLITRARNYLADEFLRFEDRILMVVPADGRSKNADKLGNEVTLWNDTPLPAAHFAVHKNWTNTLGWLAPVSFWHWHVDSYTQKVARKLNRCLYMPNVVFKVKKILTDNAGKQIRKNLNIANRDEYVWTKIRERYINADVNALGDFIKSF